MSPPEVALWCQLRGSKLGFKVRRQHPVGPYIADFFVAQAGLVIEIDGSPHDFGDRPERDLARDAYMEQRGYRVLRVLASDVKSDLEAVLKFIVVQATNPLHHPSDGPPPRFGEDL
jgi:very-short-patch-repair endonuclease